MPPKESIREVRINQNPFNAENNNIGFGQIEIFTKPGADKLRASSFFNFSDESLNSRNPFAPRRAPFQVRYYGGSVSGPITRKSSFFLDVQRRVTDDNAIINAQILNSNLVPYLSIVALLVPNSSSLSARVLTINSTPATPSSSAIRIQTQSRQRRRIRFFVAGARLQPLEHDTNVQVTETAILSPALMNETRFQYIRTRGEQNGNNIMPTIVVQDAFISGGSQVGSRTTTRIAGSCKTTRRGPKASHSSFRRALRGVSINDFSHRTSAARSPSPAATRRCSTRTIRSLDENGDPVLIPITSLERYRRTLLFQAIQHARARRWRDAVFDRRRQSGSVSEANGYGLFVQDEWRIRPNLTFTMGLRYERQTNISSNYNFAPRLFFAWAPGGTSVGGGPGAPSSSSPKMVIRGGIGVFYDRFGERRCCSRTVSTARTNSTSACSIRTVLDTSTFSLNGVSNVPTIESHRFCRAPDHATHCRTTFRRRRS